jgi:hypothetical protein
MITRKSKNRLAKEVKIVIKIKKLKPHKAKEKFKKFKMEKKII